MKREKIKVNRIEIDKRSLEPKIVEVDIKSIKDKDKKPKENKKPKKQIPVSADSQIVMTKIFGISEDENIDKRQKVFKRICVITFITLVVAVLAWTFYMDFFNNKYDYKSWDELCDLFRSTWFYAVFAIVSLLFCYLLKGLKLSVVCKNLTGKWHFKTCFDTAIIGHYYNYVTPLAVGGQPFECMYLSKHGIKGGTASSLPISTYFLNQLAFITVCLTAFILFQTNALGIQEQYIKPFDTYKSVFTVLSIIGLILTTLVPLLVIIFSILPKFGAILVHIVFAIGEKLKLIKDKKLTTYKTLKNVIHNSRCIKKVAKSPLTFLGTYLLSLGEELALGSIAYFVLRFFGFDIVGVNGFMEWLEILELCFILYISISFIPTPGNSGAADLSFYLLFDVGITSAGLAFPAMLTWRILSFYSFIIIGFIFSYTQKKIEKKKIYSVVDK